MLVLTRKQSEAILIGDDVEVFVVAIRGNKVRLGITAPGKRIRRAELQVSDAYREKGDQDEISSTT